MNSSEPVDPHAGPFEYCNLQQFQRSYAQIHGYISLVVCVFGSVANVLNICVLTRKEMRTPTNLILTGLAVADLLVMMDYLPFVYNMYIYPEARSDRDRFSYNWSSFVLFHSIFTQVCHTVAIILTLLLAVWRYIAIVHIQQNQKVCTAANTRVAIITAYMLAPLICGPMYMMSDLQSKVFRVDMNGNRVRPSDNTTAYTNETLYMTKYSDDGALIFWVYGVVIKIIPCIILTALSVRLIYALLETKRRRKTLLKATVVTTENGSDSGNRALVGGKRNNHPKHHEKQRQADRTTKMLLAVLLLFLLTEFPQGILGLLSGMLGDRFFRQCYNALGDLMDVLALINSSINFLLYCTMSRQFRTTFRATFRPKFFDYFGSAPGSTHSHLSRNGKPTQFTQV